MSVSATGLLCIDAASRRSGVALFSSNMRLLAAKAVKVPAGKTHIDPNVAFGLAIGRADEMGRRIAVTSDELSKLIKPARIIIEYPRIYREGPKKSLPGDNMLVLAAAATAAWVNLAALYPDASIEPVRPQDWKGQVPKDAMVARVLRRLASDELAYVEDPTDDNIVDAIGIGLHACRRM